MLDVRDLRSGYGSLEILHGISVRVPQENLVAILGSNGVGKSTLLRSIVGLARVWEPSVIRFKGEDITGVPTELLARRGIQLVTEELNLFIAMSVYENLLLGAHWVQDRATEGERLAYVYELFPRLQERRGQLAGTLSGGERKMLAIGRALMSGPSLLMIDEPSLGLAPRVADSVFAALVQLKSGGYSIMMAEQSVHAALEVADHVYFLERGEVAVEGAPAQVVTVESVQREYLGQRKQ